MDDEEIKPARMSRFFHWCKLGFSSIGPIKWLVLLVLGAGTATNEAIQNTVMDALTSEPLPIPAGETVVPNTISPELRQSLNSMDRKLGTHDAEILSLKQDIFELEQRRTAESDRDDDQLGTRIQTLEGFHD